MSEAKKEITEEPSSFIRNGPTTLKLYKPLCWTSVFTKNIIHEYSFDYDVFFSKSSLASICLLHLPIDTVDGRNPKQPPDMHETLQVMKIQYQPDFWTISTIMMVPYDLSRPSLAPDRRYEWNPLWIPRWQGPFDLTHGGGTDQHTLPPPKK